MVNSSFDIDFDHNASYHAALSYENVALAGPAAAPLEFPTPSVNRGIRSTVIALDQRSGKIQAVSNVLMQVNQHGQIIAPSRLYVIRKKLGRSTYGATRLCIVLKRRPVRPHGPKTESPARKRREDGRPKDEDAHWETTDELAVVKISSWAKIKAFRGRHLEDPIKEISAMQLIGNYHPNVLGCLDVLQDDDFLYTVMPYCSGGDLYGRLMGSQKKLSEMENYAKNIPGCHVDERQARIWFRQLLSGLFHLQRKGVCHRDLTLENLLVDDKNRLVIIDPGMALRVPYNDLSNPNQHTLTDVSEGSDRRLIKAQGQGGSLTYLAPEIVARDVAFDGFGIDLWAAGVILFVMLVGLAPFSTAHLSDRRFGKVAKGKLHEMLVGLKIQLSDEACDLLQNMFWMEPQKRLSLAQVMQHPWVLEEKLNTCVASNESKRAVDSTSKCPARQGKDQTVGKASFLHHKPHVRCGSAPAWI